jgi:hypothetical protein
MKEYCYEIVCAACRDKVLISFSAGENYPDSQGDEFLRPQLEALDQVGWGAVDEVGALCPACRRNKRGA